LGPDYRPTAIVGLALAAHLDAFGQSSDPTGRQSLQVVMGLDYPARVTELLKPDAPPDRMLELAVNAERAGLVPHGEVTGLAQQVRLTANPRPTVSGSWWPGLRDANALVHGSGRLSSVIDVLMCAE